jgi:DNA-directed RNA polymerase subunit RPC12/RpoP
MNDGKHCPACGKDIGLWSVLLAQTPTQVRCPHCRAKLKYERGTQIIFVIVVLAFPLLLLAYWLAIFIVPRPALTTSPIKFVSIAAAILVGLCIPLEIGLTLLLRRFGQLKRKQAEQASSKGEA